MGISQRIPPEGLKLFIHTLTHSMCLCVLNESETQWTKSGINTCSRGTKENGSTADCKCGNYNTLFYNDFVYYYFLSPIMFLIDSVVNMVKCVKMACKYP